MMRILPVILLLLLLLPAAKAENPAGISPWRERTYKAYTGGKLGDWLKVVDDLRFQYQSTGDTALLRELLYAEYGCAAFCIKEKRKNEAESILKEAGLHLNLLRSHYPGNRELTAMEAAFTGFEMGVNPIKAVYLASKARKLTEKAYTDETKNIMCISVMANALNYTPPPFGGDPAAAKRYYLKIIELYDQGLVSPVNDWRYINTMVILASVYEKEKRYGDALLLYEKIISYDPGIRWVREELLPACKSKVSASR